MSDKEITLLRQIGAHNGWVTSFSLSALMNVSVRTIKNLVHNINSAYPDLIVSSNKGFRISDRTRLAQIMSEEKKAMLPPQTLSERKKLLLRRLLLEKEPYDIDLLSAELVISPVTMQNELHSLKQELAEYELSIRTKYNKIYLEGAEEGRKKYLSLLIYTDAQKSLLSLKLIQSYLPNYDLSALRRIVSQTLRKHSYFMDDISLINLVMHLAVTMELRSLKTRMPLKSHAHTAPISGHIAAIVKDITDSIEEEFMVSFRPEEIYDFSLLVMTRAISDSINTIPLNKLGQIVGDDVMQMLDLIQEQVKEFFNITITNRDFSVRFALHLKNLRIRLKHHITLRNPQMLEIKNRYPFIYEVSVLIANIIYQHWDYQLSEDEISYIALHIGVLIEERKLIKNEVRALILNPAYFPTALELSEKCAQIFENSLLVCGVVSSEDELDAYFDYDLIITTVPLADFHQTPHVQISQFLDNRDHLAIAEKIEETIRNRTKTKLEHKLEKMFLEEFFFVNEPFKDQTDAINVMTEKLEAEQYVGPDFRKKLFEREQVSSSAYLSIAMPHPLEMCSVSSVIAVSIHHKGISWNGAKVNLVLMLAINMHDKLLFKDIFDFVTEVITQEEKLGKLLEVKSYREFIDLLVSFFQ